MACVTLVSFRWHVFVVASKQGWRGRCEFKGLWVGGLSRGGFVDLTGCAGRVIFELSTHPSCHS